MTRTAIPKKTRDAVLAEYSHRCAICGTTKPQLHHIDGDHSNHQSLNLLPLCPNCHLSDQHNPTAELDSGILSLFRKHKDPAVLKPQFYPIYIRQKFLDEITESNLPIGDIDCSVTELVEFVAEFEMGGYYSRKLQTLLKLPSIPRVALLSRDPDPAYDAACEAEYATYRKTVVVNRETARSLIIEMLRYQKWASDT